MFTKIMILNKETKKEFTFLVLPERLEYIKSKLVEVPSNEIKTKDVEIVYYGTSEDISEIRKEVFNDNLKISKSK